MELSLASTSLKEIPDIEQIPIHTLDVNSNYLRNLHHLPRSLRILHASHNQLSSDTVLVYLPHLETLNVKSNHIRFLEDADEFHECFPSLKNLYIEMNSLKHIHFTEHTRLETLHVDHNHITVLFHIPRTIKYLSAYANMIGLVQSRLPDSLITLNLSMNNLRYAGLPFYWGKNLIKLDLHYNCIEEFPRNLPDTLEILLINNNRIAELPKYLPENLKILNMNNNRIRSIPSYKKKNIQIALFNHNHIVQTEGHTWSKYFLFEDNWCSQKYHMAQKVIVPCWKRYRLCIRLRHFARTNRIKQELFELSMIPERCYQLDTLAWTLAGT